MKKSSIIITTTADRDIGPSDPEMARVMIVIGNLSLTSSSMHCEKAERKASSIRTLLRHDRLKLEKE